MNLDEITFAEDTAGTLWACSDGKLSRPILAPGHEFHNLFASSLLLYKINGDTQRLLEATIELCEMRGQNDIVEALQTQAANLQLSRRAAENGLRATLSK